MSTILVVEDDELSRDALARRLERHGYHAVTASDGEQALALARALTPDVILMDLGLPKLDGGAVARCLKREPATARIPIVVLSAHTVTDDDREAALGLGCDAVEAKPVNFGALVVAIDALLRRTPARPAPGTPPASPHS